MLHQARLAQFLRFASPRCFPALLSTRIAFAFANYPKHDLLTMPALSPTMTEGKILKWLKKEGDKVEAGDAICEVETDKATMAFQVQEKGYLARFYTGNDTIALGTPVAIIAKKLEEVKAFADYTFGAARTSPAVETPSPNKSQSGSKPTESPKVEVVRQQSNEGRTPISPLAKKIATEQGVNPLGLQGSGPNGRILRQDVEAHLSSKPVEQETRATKEKKVAPSNHFEQVPISGMRKTIAARLTESKQTIPHYYISSAVEMDALIKLRGEINAHQKENGVKISVNDMIVMAVALALRDHPKVNSQWHGNSIRYFQHADVSVAVAVENGLITPIVFRADTLGLIEIAKRTKEVAKKAREGKLDPLEYLGGTCTVSNLGMFGVDSVTSIINTPQASILGIGKTEKRMLYDGTNPDKPYRVAEVCEFIAAVDHRAVDGAVAAEWLMKIKKYLEYPTLMLL